VLVLLDAEKTRKVGQDEETFAGFRAGEVEGFREDRGGWEEDWGGEDGGFVG
jgi:hypothetical protein